jgi:outer membrane biosynthesis protein TonB
MDRLQKKCIIGSTGVHLLLVALLILGPVFVASSHKPEDNLPLLDFIPVKTVDDLISGGGNPKAKPPPAVPQPQPQPEPPPPAPQPQPQVQPPPEKQREPDPPKDKPDRPVDPDSVIAPPKHKVEIDLTPKVRKNDAAIKAKALAEAQAKEQARAQQEARRKAAASLGQAANNIGEAVAGSTSIELKGPGGGGVPYANFLQTVKTVYENAWVVPDGVTDDRATTVASVTIARNGYVVRSKTRITARSGNAAIDQSVQATLDRVDFAAPLPDTAKEDERTVRINFNLRAKQGLG